MNIMVACEESQAVTIELRKLGHRAFSCDLMECSGGHPEWHIQGDVLPLLSPGIQLQGLSHEYYGIKPFRTMDNVSHFIHGKWDMVIAFPPCTYLTVTGNRWFNVERYGEKAIQRHKDREEAVKFFMAFANVDCDCIAIENPVGVMSSRFRKPDQIVQPYQFGCPERKTTCLWLKGVAPLKPTNRVDYQVYTYANGNTDPSWHMATKNLPAEERAKARSKTFPGIARSMAEQWAGPCEERMI